MRWTGRALTAACAVRMCMEPPEKMDAIFAAPDGPTPNTEEASHLHLVTDADGEPLLTRFTYVDEHTCIGCSYCASIARNTFFMEDDHGRARVFDQHGDSEDLIAEAIDSCPVNCIHYTSHEDLVILETERLGQRINNAARLVSQQECTSDAPPSAAKLWSSGAAMRCNNCPSKGCKECPMFGVGENPVYMERMREREERRRASGEAQAEEEDQRRDALIGDLFGSVEDEEEDSEEEAVEGMVVPTSEAAIDAKLDALYGSVEP